MCRIAIALAVASAVLVVIAPGPLIEPASAQQNMDAVPSLRPPPIGSFSLVDHTGREATQMDYRGKYLLVYFGYTY